MTEERKFEFNLSETESNIVLAALAELPAKNSMAVIQKLQKQAQTQLQPVEESVNAQTLLTE